MKRFNNSRTIRCGIWRVQAVLAIVVTVLAGCSSGSDPVATLPIGAQNTGTETPVVTMESPRMPRVEVAGMWGFASGGFATCFERGGVATYDNGVWRVLETGSGLAMNAVWGTSLDDFYVVGDDGCVLHWDGQGFTEIDVGTIYDILDVWGTGTGEVWMCTSITIIRLVGTTVKTYQTGGGLPILSSFRGIGGSAPDNIYAVGPSGTLLHFDGTAWSRATTGVTVQLNSVYADGSEVFVAGDDGELWRFDGTLWSDFVVPATSDDFLAVRGGSRVAFAFGDNGLMYQWNGSAWTDMSGAFPFSPRDINAACVASNRLFAGGEYIGPGSVLHLDGSWAEVPSGAVTSKDLYDVWTFNRDRAYAIGDDGVLLERSAGGWSEVNHGLTSEQLLGIWAVDESDIYVVGDVGTFLRYDGTVWNPVNTGLGAATLIDISGSGPDDIWVLGTSSLWHWDGTTWRERWSEVPLAPSAELWCIYVAPDGTVFLGGRDLLRYDGNSWTTIGLKYPGVETFEMCGTSANDVYLAATDLLLHWDGNDMGVLLASSDVYTTAGGTNNVVVTTGNYVARIPAGPPALARSFHDVYLSGSCMGDDGVTYIVGEEGVILRVE